MTTITIDDKQKEDYKMRFSSKKEAAEALLADLGYVLLTPIESEKEQAEIEKHKIENKNRPLSDYNYL